MRSFVMELSVVMALAALCTSLATVNAGDGAWQNWTSPTNSDLTSVFMVSSNDGWAVGYGIIHWDGSRWSNVTSPTGLWLSSVFMVGASDGWAVGSFNGPIIHWDGSRWSNTASPINSEFAHLYSVFMVSANDGWAVGWLPNQPELPSPIIHWNGTAWSGVSSPTTEVLFSVFMVGASDGWAVGSRGVIVRWVGSESGSGFPEAILTPLLMTLILVVVVAVVLKRTWLKKRKAL